MINKLINLFVFLFILSLNIYSQINTEKYRSDSDSSGFTGIADIDITAITGNTDFQFINLGSRLNYNWEESYTFIVANGGFGWDKGERIFNQALAHLRHVHSINDVIQVEAFAQTDFNKKRLLIGRELFGAGLRIKILKTDDIKIRFGSSYFYELERYDVEPNSLHGSNLFANRLSEYATFELKINNNVQLILIAYVQPNIRIWNDFRIISDNSLMVSLSSLVDLKVNFSLRYDSKPPETIKSTDTITKFGLSFKF
jgi:putative salt-induced outer membrane protein YdiY